MSETKIENPDSATEKPIAETPSNVALPVAASDLTGPLIGGMPEVTNGSAPIDEKPLPDTGTVPLPGFEIKDDAGTVFNPTEHKADERGNPVKNKAGRFYSKFIGRAGSARKQLGNVASMIREPANPSFEGAPENPEQNGFSDIPAEPQRQDPSEGLALMIVPTFDGIMQSVFGADIALSKQDKEIITPVAAAYMRSKEMKDIPPGAALVLTCVAIYAPKFQKPTVKERLTLLILKIKNLFAKKSK